MHLVSGWPLQEDPCRRWSDSSQPPDRGTFEIRRFTWKSKRKAEKNDETGGNYEMFSSILGFVNCIMNPWKLIPSIELCSNNGGSLRGRNEQRTLNAPHALWNMEVEASCCGESFLYQQQENWSETMRRSSIRTSIQPSEYPSIHPSEHPTIYRNIQPSIHPCLDV